jgi:hypothetical protein
MARSAYKVSELKEKGYTDEQIDVAYAVRDLMMGPRSLGLGAICALQLHYPEIVEDPKSAAAYLGYLVSNYGRVNISWLIYLKRHDQSMSFGRAVSRVGNLDWKDVRATSPRVDT